MHACQFELFSPLNFIENATQDVATLRHLDGVSNAANFAPLDVVTLMRPTQNQFKSQLELVMNWSQLREERAAEVLSQDANSSAYWSSVFNLRTNRHKYTAELLALAHSLAIHVEMRFKHTFACPRPAEYSVQIQPMIATPGHGSWPSGHSTEAFLAANVIEALVGEAYDPLARPLLKDQLQRLAARVAINRTIAGVHFPVDSAAGRVLGDTLGGYFVHRCQGTVPYEKRLFDGTQFQLTSGGALDFSHTVALNNGTFNQVLGTQTLSGSSAILKKLWELARAEWGLLP
jgi:hypothetical protein